MKMKHLKAWVSGINKSQQTAASINTKKTDPSNKNMHNKS